MSVHIVAFGNERDGFSEDDQKSLIWTYLGRSALVSETDSNLLLNSANYLRNPAFTEYQACVFGNVRLVVHDCPLWDIFESDWYTSRNLIGEADIIVIKYSVNDKSSFQEVKDIYAPLIKKTLSHCSVPVIISAVGARQNDPTSCCTQFLMLHLEEKIREIVTCSEKGIENDHEESFEELSVFSLRKDDREDIMAISKYLKWCHKEQIQGRKEICIHIGAPQGAIKCLEEEWAHLLNSIPYFPGLVQLLCKPRKRHSFFKEASAEVPCTCPLCISDRGSCVTASEGIQLAKELGATYLELHSLNDFYIGKYFGGVLEYFMIQSLNQKSSEKMKKRKKSHKCHGVKPPQLDQPEKMPILKGEASHYDSDLHKLLFCCQCVDVIFYSEDLKEVAEAHRIVLCSISHVFMLLFNVKSPTDIQDSSIIRTAQTLFAANQETVFPILKHGTSCSSPVRVIVKDSFFCSCLTDILHFIYSGAFQWELLEEHIKKKLKNPSNVELVLERVKCILKIPGKVNSSQNYRTYLSERPLQLCNSSLRLFFNTTVLADVMFKIQGTTVPAHKAVLVARCEVMAAMFNGNYIESNSFLVPVYGISKDTFLSFLEYLYTDSCCPASILQAMSLLICAEMYQVSRLQHICELYIITQLQSMPSRELASTSLSVVSLLQKAKFHNSDCLSNWLLHFIASNYLIFSQKPEFEDLSVEERNFVEMHRWPSSMYLRQLAEYRNYIHSRKCHCIIM